MSWWVSHVLYKPPKQEEEVDEAFLKQLIDISRSWDLVLMGDFYYHKICWEDNSA